MKQLIPIIFLFFFFQLSSQDSLRYSVYFESNDTEISDQNDEEINKLLLDAIKSIKLEGHTDNLGDIASNLTLSQDRVLAVKNSLIKKGVPENKIESSYFGESKPLNNNLNESEKALNRRVDIVFYYTKLEKKNLAKAEKEENLEKENNNDIYPYLSELKKEQHFRISNKKDTVLKTLDGIIFYFPKHCFASNCDSISLTIIELNTPKDNIINNVTTVSNNRIIYSYGMLDIKAKCGNQIINIKPYKKYTVLFPVGDQSKEDKVLGFYGTRDSITQEVNWVSNPSRSLEIVSGDGFGICGPQPKKYCWLISWMVKSTQKLQREREIAIHEKREQIQKKYRNLNHDQLRSIVQADLNYYVFQPNKMGLVNVDAFWNVKEENQVSQQIYTNESITAGIELKMVFKHRQSIISASKTRTFFEFEAIPTGEKVFIVGLKRTKNKIKLILEEIVTGTEVVKLEFEEISSFQELDKRLELIN